MLVQLNFISSFQQWVEQGIAQIIEQIRWRAKSIARKVIAVRVPGGLTPP